MSESDKSNDTRATIALVAEAMKQSAADLVARGMAMTERAARLEQLSRIAKDEQCETILKILVKEGLVKGDECNIQLNSPGGDA